MKKAKRKSGKKKNGKAFEYIQVFHFSFIETF